jgi:hypothetical protein
MGRWLSAIWNNWTRIARRLADIQGRVVLGLLYLLLVCPVGAMLRTLRDPLGRRRPTESNWVPRDARVSTLDEARRH